MNLNTRSPSRTRITEAENVGTGTDREDTTGRAASESFNPEDSNLNSRVLPGRVPVLRTSTTVTARGRTVTPVTTSKFYHSESQLAQ